MKNNTIRFIAAIALSSLAAACNKEMPDAGQPAAQAGDGTFILKASVAGNTAPSSKTTVSDTWTLSWNANDKMSVIVNDGTTAHANEFTNTAGGTTFTTTSTNFPLAAGTYSYHALYPYSEGFTGLNPDGTIAGLVRIPQGSAPQSAAGDRSHLGNQPLYGHVEGLSESTVPTITMHHLTAVIQINFKNLSNQDVKVSKIVLSNNGNVYMGGKYGIDCKTGKITASSVSADMSKNATLTVNDVVVAGNTTAAFYVPVAPCTISSGKILTTMVYTDKGTFKFEKRAGNNTELKFDAGKVRAMTVIYASSPGNVADNSTTVTDMPPITVGGVRYFLMDRNLGATANDPLSGNAKGDLYQWGRGADGHQKVIATTESGQFLRNATVTPGITGIPSYAQCIANPADYAGKFIISGSGKRNWVTDVDHDNSALSLWQDTGIQNPCPAGYRIPTKDEWKAILGFPDDNKDPDKLTADKGV